MSKKKTQKREDKMIGRPQMGGGALITFCLCHAPKNLFDTKHVSLPQMFEKKTQKTEHKMIVRPQMG